MAFNINAQVILSGPKNIRAVTQSIQQQLGNINANVNLGLPKGAQQQVTNLGKATQNLAKNTNKLNNSAQTASRSVANVGKSTKQAASAMQVLGKETALTFKRFAAAGIVTGTVFRLTQAISESVGKALEFERGLVRLQQITGKTVRQLDGLKNTVRGLATSFGQDANEILEIGQIFAQTGQSIREIQSSITAVARSSLAPTFGDMASTAEGLVAALNQFGIAASESEAILGSLNRVSKRFAVESDDLIAAIRRAGGVFALSAGDVEKPIDALNQFVGVFTAVRSTTRESAETVATGLRTIFSRVQRRGTIDVLKQLGINLTDTNGKFVGLFESFRILSRELDSLVQKGDTITLSAITEELGGIRQIGKLIPAIRNFNKAEAAFREAQAGAIEGLGGDVQKGLTPLIKTFEQIQTRFSDLIRTITESASFQSLAKTAAGLANAFLSVAETLTPLLPLIIKFATIKIGRGAAGFFQGFTSGFGGAGARGVGQTIGGALSGGGAGRAQAGATSALSSASAKLAQATAANTSQLQQNTKAVIANNIALNSIIRRINIGGVGFGGLAGGRGGRRPRGFNRGGLVPGSGNSDTVPAMLTPGEFVIRKSATQAFGAGNLAGINKYAAGGVVGSLTPEFTMGVLKGLGPAPRRFNTSGASVRAIANEGAAARVELEEAFRRDTNIVGLGINDEIRLLQKQKGNVNPLAGKGKKAAARRSRIASQLKGRGNVGKLNNFKTRDEVVGFLRTAEVETEAGQQAGINALLEGASLIAPRAFATGVNPKFKDIFGDILQNRLPTLLSTSLGDFGKELASLPQPLNRLLDNSALGSIEGQLFEGFTRLATQNFIAQGAGDKVSPLFDVLAGEGDINRYRALFTGFQFPGEIKNIFSSENIASTFGKAVKNFKSEAIRFNPAMVEKFSKFATGGMASGTDTVPALLTPGEFVVNKKSAQAIGYGNLKNINKYAKGGVVQRFNNGGGVKKSKTGRQTDAGNLAFILPDLLFTIPALTESFKQLEEGVEGATGQVVTNIASLGITVALVAKEFGGLGPALASLGKTLISPIGLFAALGAGLLFFSDSQKKAAQELLDIELKAFDSSIKTATESLNRLGKEVTTERLLKANQGLEDVFSQFNKNFSNINETADRELFTISSIFKGLKTGASSLGESIGVSPEGTTRSTIDIEKTGGLSSQFFERFTTEFAETAQKAFSNTQKKLVSDIVASGKAGQEALKNLSAAIDPTNFQTATTSLFKFSDEISKLGPLGQQAGENLRRNLQVQLAASIQNTEDLSKRQRTLLQSATGRVSSGFARAGRDPFANQREFESFITAIQQDLGKLGADAIPTTEAFQKLITSLSTTQAELLKSTNIEASLQSAIQQTQIVIESFTNSLNKLSSAAEGFTNGLDRINANLDSTISSLIEGTARFEFDELQNPFANLDLLKGLDANEIRNRFEKGFQAIDQNLGAEAGDIARELDEAVLVASKFDDIFKNVITNVEAQSAQRAARGEGAIPTPASVSAEFRRQLGGFAETDIGEKVVSSFDAALTSSRETRGVDINPLQILRQALSEGGDLIGDFAGSLENARERLESLVDSAREVEQAELDRAKQERRVVLALRDIEGQRRAIQERVGDITGARAGGIGQAGRELSARVGALAGGRTTAASIGTRQREVLEQINALKELREELGALPEGLAKGFANLQSEFADNTDALKLLAEDTTRLAAVQERIAQSRQGAVGLLGRLGQVQERARRGDFAGAREEAIEIKRIFATIAKLQQGIPLTLTEASKVLGGEFDGIIRDLGATPEQLKVLVNQGFQQAPGAIQGAAAQFGVFLPPNAFQDINLGPLADQIGKEQGAALNALAAQAKLANEAIAKSKIESDNLSKSFGITTTALNDFNRTLLHTIDLQAIRNQGLTVQGLEESRERAVKIFGEDSEQAKDLAKLIAEQKAVLEQIRQGTTTTAGILKAEQGPNSFNVYDQTSNDTFKTELKKAQEQNEAGAAVKVLDKKLDDLESARQAGEEELNQALLKRNELIDQGVPFNAALGFAGVIQAEDKLRSIAKEKSLVKAEYVQASEVNAMLRNPNPVAPPSVAAPKAPARKPVFNEFLNANVPENLMNYTAPGRTLQERRNRLEQYQTGGKRESSFAGLLRAGSNAASTQKARGVLSNIDQQIAKIEAAKKRGGGTLDPRVQERLDLLKERRTGLMGIQGVRYAPDPVAGGGPAGGAGGANLDPRLPLPAGGAGGANLDPRLPLPPGAIQRGPYRPGPLDPGAIQPLAGAGATSTDILYNRGFGPQGGGAPAGGGGVAGPDVAMNNLAQALNAVRDGFQINVGEINVTISNATELANSIKSMVVEAVKESVGSADLNNAPAAGSVSSTTDGPPGAYA